MTVSAGKIVITDLDNTDNDDGHWNNDGSQLCSVSLFADAVQVWSHAQGRDTTINEAALVFNVTPELIKKTIDYHPYISVTSDGVMIHEGE